MKSLTTVLLLIFTSVIVAKNVEYSSKSEIKVKRYGFGNTRVNEFRERGGLNRVVVKPGRGPTYILQDQKSTTSIFQDHNDENAYFPGFIFKTW